MAKRKIIWSSIAKLDLIEIFDFFYKRNGNKTYSKKLNIRIRKAIRLLIKHPDLGIQTDIPNIRSLIEGDYAIFYEIKSDNIQITAIWDCRQNPEKLIFK